jgi:hypothetical protein
MLLEAKRKSDNEKSLTELREKKAYLVEVFDETILNLSKIIREKEKEERELNEKMEAAWSRLFFQEPKKINYAAKYIGGLDPIGNHNCLPIVMFLEKGKELQDSYNSSLVERDSLVKTLVDLLMEEEKTIDDERGDYE